MLTRGRMLYFALALLFAISLTCRIREIIDRVDLVFHGTERAKSPFSMNVPGVEITGVEPEAAAAGIRKGDTLLAFAERPYRGALDFYIPLREARPGDRLNVQVRPADGSGQEFVDRSATLARLLPESNMVVALHMAA